MPHNQPEKESFPRSEAASPSFEHLILEGETFGIVVFQPSFRGVGAGKDLEVIAISDLLARIHVNENSHGWIQYCRQGSGPDQHEDPNKPGPLTSEGLGGMSRKLT